MSVLEWRDPPTRRNAIFDPATVEELKQRPGEWALLREYNHNGPGFRVKTPKGVECRIVQLQRGGKRRAELYGRWVGC
jgi:hypothetical protein